MSNVNGTGANTEIDIHNDHCVVVMRLPLFLAEQAYASALEVLTDFWSFEGSQSVESLKDEARERAYEALDDDRVKPVFSNGEVAESRRCGDMHSDDLVSSGAIAIAEAAGLALRRLEVGEALAGFPVNADARCGFAPA